MKSNYINNYMHDCKQQNHYKLYSHHFQKSYYRLHDIFEMTKMYYSCHISFK